MWAGLRIKIDWDWEYAEINTFSLEKTQHADACNFSRRSWLKSTLLEAKILKLKMECPEVHHHKVPLK